MSTTVVTLSDVKLQLNIPSTDTSNDAELQGFIDAAEGFIAYRTGPLSSTSFTETHDGGWPQIAVYNTPIVSVTSLVEYIGPTAYTLTLQPPGSTVDNYGFSIDDATAGIITRRSGAGTPISFFGGPRSVIVTYQAGLTAIPPEVRLACLMDIQGMWQQTQQSGRPAFPDTSGGDFDSWSGLPVHPFPRLAALLDGPMRTQSVA